MNLKSTAAVATLAACSLPALAGNPESPCATTVQLTNEPHDLSNAPRIVVQPGEYVCWTGSSTQKIAIGSSAYYRFDVIPGNNKGGQPRGGVRGMAGFSSMVHVEDVKDGRRVTFFVHTDSTDSAQSKR